MVVLVPGILSIVVGLAARRRAERVRGELADELAGLDRHLSEIRTSTPHADDAAGGRAAGAQELVRPAYDALRAGDADAVRSALVRLEEQVATMPPHGDLAARTARCVSMAERMQRAGRVAERSQRR